MKIYQERLRVTSFMEILQEFKEEGDIFREEKKNLELLK
jgi:hypothetical protein